jgi:hypothetical protein
MRVPSRGPHRILSKRLRGGKSDLPAYSCSRLAFAAVRQSGFRPEWRVAHHGTPARQGPYHHDQCSLDPVEGNFGPYAALPKGHGVAGSKPRCGTRPLPERSTLPQRSGVSPPSEKAPDPLKRAGSLKAAPHFRQEYCSLEKTMRHWDGILRPSGTRPPASSLGGRPICTRRKEADYQSAAGCHPAVHKAGDPSSVSRSLAADTPGRRGRVS